MKHRDRAHSPHSCEWEQVLRIVISAPSDAAYPGNVWVALERCRVCHAFKGELDGSA